MSEEVGKANKRNAEIAGIAAGLLAVCVEIRDDQLQAAASVGPNVLAGVLRYHTMKRLQAAIAKAQEVQ